MMTVDASALLLPGPWNHRFVTANGSRFHLVTAGPDDRDAPLVVLLHGTLGFWWSWRHQISALADHGYRVVAMDLRGTGASDKPPSGYDVPTLVSDVSGVIRSLGADRAVVVGTGSGGMVAWAVPALIPGVARAVGVLAAPRPTNPDGTPRPVMRTAALRGILYAQLPAFPEHSLAQGDMLLRLLDAWGGAPGWLDADAVARYRDALRVPFAAHSQLEQLRWLTRSVPRADGARLRTRLASSDPVPVLQVQGLRDGLFDPARAALTPVEVAMYTDGYRYEAITAAGHFPAEQAPELVTSVLLDWLAETAPLTP
jgi:pimeloyl-ACP methyl ester carboxylesterase